MLSAETQTVKPCRLFLYSSTCSFGNRYKNHKTKLNTWTLQMINNALCLHVVRSNHSANIIHVPRVTCYSKGNPLRTVNIPTVNTNVSVLIRLQNSFLCAEEQLNQTLKSSWSNSPAPKCGISADRLVFWSITYNICWDMRTTVIVNRYCFQMSVMIFDILQWYHWAKLKTGLLDLTCCFQLEKICRMNYYFSW